ncbi:MAG: DUF4139 domain-containing protein [Phycisphaerae bacterium]|nr:DUF4139 domain-containing protein [Phycisphaerae bacterium]
MSTMRSGLVFVCLAASLPAAELPVKQVTLYSSGVACYQRLGTVDGDAAINMPFKTEQINDILKSLVLIDLDGGRIEPVVYASKDPIEKSLKAFGVDLTKRPTLRELFDQLRGVPVELMLHTQSQAVSGNILGTEIHKVIDKEGQATQVEYVNLVCADGLRTFAIGDLRSARLLDEKLEAELTQALAVLAGARDVGKKSVALRFTGQGSRRVMAAYVLEAPVWKTSYRLVLSDGEEPLLQGWAMVDNTTDEDWGNVQLTLVSGRPISFVQDLYSPLYVPRPEVKPEVYASLRPRKYDGDVDYDSVADEEAYVGAKLTKRKPRRAMRGKAAMPPPAAAEGISYGYAVPFAPAGPAISAGIAGVASMAQASEAGELFKYEIQTPVTIARQKSAMLPIVNEAVAVEKLSIFNESVHGKYPLNGLQLTNSTRLNLMQGPITVFDVGIYAGDAQLDDMSPTEKRLISYAMDLEREVVAESESTPTRITAMRIAKGTLIVTNKYVQTKHYRIKNKGDIARSVLVEHPYNADWKLVEPKDVYERTGVLYRFKVETVAGKTSKLTVREERITDQSVVIRNAGRDRITHYLRAKVISKSVREALERVARMRASLEQQEREAERLRSKLRSINQEQGRLRSNLGAVRQGSDLYRRYISKLEKQETEIEQTQGALAEVEAEIERKRRELDNYLLNLNVQ